MALRTQAGAEHTNGKHQFEAKVIDGGNSFEKSKKAGELLTFEDLPTYLKPLIGELEKTKSFKQRGFVRFYINTMGTGMKGPFEFEINGRTVAQMFQPVTKDRFGSLQPERRAYFFNGGGERPLTVELRRASDSNDVRIVIGADLSTNDEAATTVTVVKKLNLEIAKLVRETESITAGEESTKLVVTPQNGERIELIITPGTTAHFE